MARSNQHTDPRPKPSRTSLNASEHFVWLASFPRSGNTYLRTILWNCFGLRSGSIYPNDLGQNVSLEQAVGHIEHCDGRITFPPGQEPQLVKTHEHDRDDKPAIYIVRDGRAAILSLWEFYGHRVPIETLLRGEHQFGKWQDHLAAWDFGSRAKTLFLRYEDVLVDLDSTLSVISDFLKHRILARRLPARESIASRDGRWVRSAGDHADNYLSREQLELFNSLNARGLQRAGYA